MTFPQTTSRRDSVWLNLTFEDGRCITSVEIPRAEALRLDRRGFAKIYRGHVCGATRREARAWADRQIALRDSVVRAQTELAAR